jgi:hypothetical protein
VTLSSVSKVRLTREESSMGLLAFLFSLLQSQNLNLHTKVSCYHTGRNHVDIFEIYENGDTRIEI